MPSRLTPELPRFPEDNLTGPAAGSGASIAMGTKDLALTTVGEESKDKK